MLGISGTDKFGLKRPRQQGILNRDRLRGALCSVVLAFIACVCNNDKSRKDQSSPDPSTVIEKPEEVPDGPKSIALDSIIEGFKISELSSKADLLEFTSEPHPLGSKRQLQYAAILEVEIKKTSFQARRMAFAATVPNPEKLTMETPVPLTLTKEGHNVFAWGALPTKNKCTVALASHYDTKIVPNIEYRGANDGGSSTIALLHIMRDLASRGVQIYSQGQNNNALHCDIMMIWFDGEEAVLPGWTDGLFNHPARIQDNTYGSRFLASLLTPCTLEGIRAFCLPKELGMKPLIAVIVLDMIGSPGIKLIKDSYSSPWMVTLQQKTAATLGLGEIMEKGERGVEDDHIPFVRLGVSGVDLIDFTNLTYWHAPGDDPEKVAFDSIDKAAKIGLKMALDIAMRPKDFLILAEEKVGK